MVVRLPAGASGAFQLNWPRYISKTATRMASSQTTPVSRAPSYRVRRGDSLGGIARKNGLSVSELRRLNGLRSDRIYEGQRLRVSTG